MFSVYETETGKRVNICEPEELSKFVLETVKYYQCPMNFSDSLDTEENLSAIRKVFSILADKTNYPTFFHCSIGTDRTGYIAFLINAYLGVEEENFIIIYGSSDPWYAVRPDDVERDNVSIYVSETTPHGTFIGSSFGTTIKNEILTKIKTILGMEA